MITDYRMLAVTIILWIIALLVLFANRRNEANIWGSAFAFVCGLGGLNTILADVFRIVITPEMGMNLSPLLTFHSLTTAFIHYAAPYSYLMFALSHSGEFERRGKRWRVVAYLIGLLPLLVCSIFFPPHVFSYFRDYARAFWPSSMWIIPLEIYASYILIKGYIIEKNPKEKKAKLIACVIMIPATLYAVVVHYVLMVILYTEIWRHEWVVALCAFIVFITAVIRFGLMGLKITVDRQSLNASLSSAQVGTAMIGHALKNSLTKLELCIDNIKTEPTDEESLEIAGNTLSHLKKLSVNLTNSLTKKEIKNELVNLSILIDEVVAEYSAILAERKIQIIRGYEDSEKLFCDIILVREVLNNVILNSIEAIQNDGIIEISVIEERRRKIIAITDNGTGIPAELLQKVFAPFYTRKTSDSNYGLGLSFCYKVMKQHGGKIEITSDLGVMTKVSLVFNNTELNPL